jgi:hypothetical protein
MGVGRSTRAWWSVPVIARDQAPPPRRRLVQGPRPSGSLQSGDRWLQRGGSPAHALCQWHRERADYVRAADAANGLSAQRLDPTRNSPQLQRHSQPGYLLLHQEHAVHHMHRRPTAFGWQLSEVICIGIYLGLLRRSIDLLNAFTVQNTADASTNKLRMTI